MSVYHSIRSSIQLVNSVDETTIDQDGMVLVDINSGENEPTEIVQSELNRVSGQVDLHIFLFILFLCVYSSFFHRQLVAFHAFKIMLII